MKERTAKAKELLRPEVHYGFRASGCCQRLLGLGFRV